MQLDYFCTVTLDRVQFPKIEEIQSIKLFKWLARQNLKVVLSDFVDNN